MTSPEDVAWLSVEDRSAPGQVRRRVAGLAERLGFDEHRRGEVAVAATELATNLHRHAVAGTVAIRVRREGQAAAIELVVVDAGPGIADLATAMADGHSTAGSLGVGLGAVRRIATRYDAFSALDRGTAIVVTFWPAAPPSPPARVEGITRAMRSETVCGDAWACRHDDGVTTVVVADGLGHGPLAAVASQKAVAAFEAMDPAEPGDVLGTLDRALAGTRGAAVSVVRIDPGAGRAQFAGVGNVAGWVDDGHRRHPMVSFPGIVGSHQKARKIRQLDYDAPPGALVVLHSDGLSSKWTLADHPTIRRHDPLVIAAWLLRDAGVRRDDASVVVARAS